jgi:hypothetical protein
MTGSIMGERLKRARIIRVPGLAFALLLAILLPFLPACRKATPNVADNAPRVEEAGAGAVKLQLIATPPRVAVDRDLLLTIRITAPSNLAVHLPMIEDRLQGFTLNGAFDREPQAANGQVLRERCLQLTPDPIGPYRIAPMAIRVQEAADPTAESTWFATRPMVFEAAPLVSSKNDAQMGSLRNPVPIYPETHTVLLVIALLLLAGTTGFLLWKLSRRIHREIKLRRMSPRERALHELAELMARDLTGPAQVKEFYFELTMIVRRYIERAHGVRAPEQTTEEFLEAVSRDPRFTREVVARLRAFLQAADLVKFAAFQPDQPTVDRATSTAKDYIETDATAAAEAAQENAGPPATGVSRRGQEH